MKHFLLTAFFATVLLVPASHAEWLTNYEMAREQAQKENKTLFMDFTGSDWCPPCMFMEQRVYSSDAFKKYAEKNLVLLKLDFPLRTPSLPAIQKQNNELAVKYDAENYRPTVILLNSKGKELARESGIANIASPDQLIGWINSQIKS